MTGRRRLVIETRDDAAPNGCVVLRITGVLDAGTYQQLRDAIIKAALGAPRVVIAHVDAMTVSTPSALAAFTSARWHVSQWPDVPIVVAAADDALRHTFDSLSVSKYVPVYPTVQAAVAAVGRRTYRYRRRAVVSLEAGTATVRADAFVDETLTAWTMSDRRLAIATVVRALVENAVAHGHGGWALRLETDGEAITVAVSDDNPTPAIRRERHGDDARIRGLDLVAALSRAWRNSPTGTGKTVWAVVGPENDIGGLARAVDTGGR